MTPTTSETNGVEYDLLDVVFQKIQLPDVKFIAQSNTPSTPLDSEDYGRWKDDGNIAAPRRLSRENARKIANAIVERIKESSESSTINADNSEPDINVLTEIDSTVSVSSNLAQNGNWEYSTHESEQLEDIRYAATVAEIFPSMASTDGSETTDDGCANTLAGEISPRSDFASPVGVFGGADGPADPSPEPKDPFRDALDTRPVKRQSAVGRDFEEMRIRSAVDLGAEMSEHQLVISRSISSKNIATELRSTVGKELQQENDSNDVVLTLPIPKERRIIVADVQQDSQSNEEIANEEDDSLIENKKDYDNSNNTDDDDDPLMNVQDEISDTTPLPTYDYPVDPAEVDSHLATYFAENKNSAEFASHPGSAIRTPTEMTLSHSPFEPEKGAIIRDELADGPRVSEIRRRYVTQNEQNITLIQRPLSIGQLVEREVRERDAANARQLPPAPPRVRFPPPVPKSPREGAVRQIPTASTPYPRTTRENGHTVKERPVSAISFRNNAPAPLHIYSYSSANDVKSDNGDRSPLYHTFWGVGGSLNSPVSVANREPPVGSAAAIHRVLRSAPASPTVQRAQHVDPPARSRAPLRNVRDFYNVWGKSVS